MEEIDKIIHEPTRLRIMMILAGLEEADFTFLVPTLDLTRGNLNRHMEKLESAGYLKVKRSFKGKVRNTSYQITQKGSKALAQYWENIDAVRRLGKS
ncbi:MAG: ArsR family transcriptional regulator [Planctomycetes bacterium RBG_19FT_COMBO_48_8]|nr:MAG: ArsR family transcriptional regulator [Planctomycetes bacterium RBG_19FT_COMBO_48_8]